MDIDLHPDILETFRSREGLLSDARKLASGGPVAEHELENVLYYRYLHMSEAAVGRIVDNASLVESIASANSGKGFWSLGWTRIRSGESTTVVCRDKVFYTAASEHVRGGASSAEVYLPAVARRLDPGFVVSFGEAGATSASAGLTVRVYFNVPRELAAHFVGMATHALNSSKVPFQLKSASRAAGYARADTAVLFLPIGSVGPNLGVISELVAQSALIVRPNHPKYLASLTAGIGVALEPETNLSFGRHICKILAAALLESGTVHEFAQAVADRGVSPMTPFALRYGVGPLEHLLESLSGSANSNGNRI